MRNALLMFFMMPILSFSSEPSFAWTPLEHSALMNSELGVKNMAYLVNARSEQELVLRQVKMHLWEYGVQKSVNEEIASSFKTTSHLLAPINEEGEGEAVGENHIGQDSCKRKPHPEGVAIPGAKYF